LMSLDTKRGGLDNAPP